ncbi:MAG TPA: class I SAM-dependent methyltransferase [Elusimicrobiota bacterium]|nr:class I SAM-dependent methyltransferase [Elusimicrobiota bacterium]
MGTVSFDHFDTRFGHDARYGIARCAGCGLEQTLPRPDADGLRRLYESHYNFGAETGTRYTRWRERFLLSPLYRAWLTLDGDISFHCRRGRGLLLDYGCNEGRGLVLYRRNGFNVEGLEVNRRAAAVAESRGFRVTSESLADFRPAQPYNAIVLSNVLEHALDPRLMLRQVRALLAPGGELWISCPNAASWLRTLFGRFWINWHVPFHIVHFTPRSLSELLQSEGFAVRESTCETPGLWVAQSLLSRLFARQGRPTRPMRSAVWVGSLTLAARGLLFPILWLGNRLQKGDCLVFIARKESEKPP